MSKPDLDDYKLAWLRETERLRPEIMRDPVASAVVKMAEQVFDAYAVMFARLVENRNATIGELRARLAQAQAELDTVQRRHVLHCPKSGMMDAMQASLDEEPGTIMRCTDEMGLEFELKDRQWVLR